MNKILTTLGLVLGLAGSAVAQSHVSQSFLNVKSVMVSNTVILTNLSMSLNANVVSNLTRTIYTNLGGSTATVTTGTDRSQDYKALVKDVSLWGAEGTGLPPFVHVVGTAGSDASPTNGVQIGSSTVFIQFIGGASASGNLTFTFDPVWDGVTPSIAAGDRWTVTAALAAGTVSLATNVPTWRWPGAKALRLSGVANADATGDNGEAWLTKVQLNGFRP